MQESLKFHPQLHFCSLLGSQVCYSQILYSKSKFDSFLTASLTACLAYGRLWFCDSKYEQRLSLMAYRAWHFQAAVTKFFFNSKHQTRNSVIHKHCHECRDIVLAMWQLHWSSLWFFIQILRKHNEDTDMFFIIAALAVSFSLGLQSYATGLHMVLHTKEIKT